VLAVTALRDVGGPRLIAASPVVGIPEMLLATADEVIQWRSKDTPGTARKAI